MLKHLKYLKYLLLHKYWVFYAGLKLKVSIWRLLIHDWSKFLPCEWFAYTNYFYGNHPKFSELPSALKSIWPAKSCEEYWKDKFDFSWNHHSKFNKHHFQFWVLIEDSGKIKPLKMPEKYVREMTADWEGAGRAITGKWEAWDYYQKNKENTLLHPESRELFERLLRNFKP